jgi:predicted lysophospholipase L1 biosynthesis ABC-type transport system permease subunit
MIALGVSREGAVATFVLDRALIIAIAILLALVVGFVFRDLLGRALRAA